MIAIKTVHLTKKYKELVAVDDLTLEIEKGELFALLGINGAGKSTTVKMLSCLTSPTEGDAFVEGYSILRDAQSVKGVIGVSPQESALAPNLSVRENLELVAGIYGLRGESREDKIGELAKRFGLSDILSRRAGKLSGGQARRVSIAMALITEPSVLFLDEPTLGLDVIAKSELWDVIRALKGRVTVILTTHSMEEAEALSDRVGIMKDGRLLVVGTARELTERTGTGRLEDAFVAIVREAKK